MEQKNIHRLGDFFRRTAFPAVVFLFLFLPFAALAQNYIPPSERLTSFVGWPDRPDEILFGVLVGTLFAAACYVFFIWSVIRDRSQIYLVLMLLTLAANLGLNTPFVTTFFNLNDVSWLMFAHLLSVITFEICACLFTINFLETELYSPPLTQGLRAAIAALFIILMITGIDTAFINYIMPLIVFVICMLLLLTGLWARRHRIPGSITHLIAFSILLVGGLSSPLQTLNLIPRGMLSDNMFYLATASAGLLFALGIAGQFGHRQEEKERQLLRSNERFSLAALGSHDGLYDWNIARRTLYVSDRLRRILGSNIQPDARGIRQWYELIVPEDRPVVRRHLMHFLHSEANTISLEYRIHSFDGGERWLYSTGVARRHPQTHKVLRLVGSTGDVTAKKTAEFALRASEARFRSIAEAHPVPVLISRVGDSRILYASPGVSTLLGMPLADLIGRGTVRFFANENERQDFLEEIVSTGRVDLREITLRRIDDVTIPTVISGRLIDYQGQSAVVLGVYDLSERKAAEAEIAQQREALERNERMAALGSLLAGVAHELNNPLSIVVGQSSLLYETTSDEKTKTRAGKIQKAAERCTRIVRNFLALARRQEPERHPISLVQVAHGALELFGGQIRQNNVKIIEEFMPNPPMVHADQDQLHQVVSNLIINAIHALTARPDHRQITIRIGVAPENDKEIELAVIDNGPGVPEAFKARIFEPFFTTKQAGQGTGIGLSLCLSIIESHQGKFMIRDTPGGGATFTVTLPTLTAAASLAVAEKENAEAHAEKLPPQHILIVDDEPDVAQILADILKNEGHSTKIAEHGQAAVDILNQENFDFIISDLRMPVMDGPAFYSVLKQSFPHYIPRIFFVTGDTLSDHVRDFLSLNPIQVVDKPYLANDIRLALFKQAGIKKAAEADNRLTESSQVTDTAKSGKA